MSASHKERGVVRVNVEIPIHLHERLSPMPHGTRAAMLRGLLGLVADAFEKHGPIIFGAVMSGDFELTYRPPAVPSRDTTSEE